jgi:hypothetical protein
MSNRCWEELMPGGSTIIRPNRVCSRLSVNRNPHLPRHERSVINLELHFARFRKY